MRFSPQRAVKLVHLKPEKLLNLELNILDTDGYYPVDYQWNIKPHLVFKQFIDNLNSYDILYYGLQKGYNTQQGKYHKHLIYNIYYNNISLKQMIYDTAGNMLTANYITRCFNEEDNDDCITLTNYNIQIDKLVIDNEYTKISNVNNIWSRAINDKPLTYFSIKDMLERIEIYKNSIEYCDTFGYKNAQLFVLSFSNPIPIYWKNWFNISFFSKAIDRIQDIRQKQDYCKMMFNLIEDTSFRHYIRKYML